MNSTNEQVKVALITGAARRIGAGIAEHLHQQGFRIAVHYHQSKHEVQQLVAQLNQGRTDSAFALAADLSVEQEVHRIIPAVLSKWQRLDVLVNNASIFQANDLLAADVSDWDRQWMINCKAPYLLSVTAIDALRKQQGCIVNITDVHAETPLSGFSQYGMTKAALTSLTRSMAKECAPDIRVNAVAPGNIMLPEGENALSDTMIQKLIKRTWLKRLGDPLAIAQAVVFLVNNQFITGQVLRIDGGRS